MLTIFTWLWSQPGGRTKYTPFHVNLWASRVRKHLTIPARIACVTHEPEGIDPSIEIITPPRDFDDVRIPTWGNKYPQCLRRISMFRPDAAKWFGDRFVSMDMDSVIAGNLDDLFTDDSDFRMYRGTSAARPYNGSMLMMRAGARPEVFTSFTPERAVEAGQQFVGSDQAWISYVLGRGERTWDANDGVMWWWEYKRENPEAVAPRLIFFPGDPKPWELTDKEPFVREHYRLARNGGRCLILGYGQNVWSDAQKALAAGKYAGVIASPEAAEQWPGQVDAIAMTDDEAEALAFMHGFDEWTFCGRQRRESAA